jgi:nitrogen fixation/metabolism regulation signal transduction histidine kinase
LIFDRRRSDRLVELSRYLWAFEQRIGILSAALVILALLCGGWSVLRLEIDPLWHALALAALTLIMLALGMALRNAIVEPLRGLTNVVEAYRGGNYTIRSSREMPGDVLGDLAHEINSLGETLQIQRLRALEATALLEKLIGAIDAAVMAFDGEGRLRLSNPAAVQLLQPQVGTPIGLTATELGLGKLLREDARDRIETVLAGRSGRWQITHGTFREDGLAQHLLIVSDVSRVLREEERLVWQRLIRVIGHEVNNSLAPIRSLTQTLHELLSVRLSPGSEAQEILGGLQVIADRTRTLSSFLAQYSRLARLPPPRVRWLKLAPLLKRVTALELLHRIEIEMPADLEVRVDEDQLEQALINLARNAVEAQGPGDGRVVIAAHARQDHLLVSITDEGPGVANPDNLFVPFFTTKPGGSGIGLLLSRQIAEAHGGTLSLRNNTGGRGAVATVEIPGAARIRATC